MKITVTDSKAGIDRFKAKFVGINAEHRCIIAELSPETADCTKDGGISFRGCRACSEIHVELLRRPGT